ncbi:MAG: UTP--glucose-1-phosphate uridylyltransferase GalU [Methanothrix sp.]|jgi:UTP--glucose-1-phosphate uridylyltransferase|nr:UTP--glucose-1-phosphate uridylyltransferase GalU [Methanothrix sp.]
MRFQTVRKAVIPAAGLGIRFLPMTKAQPKEMLPVVDKPVIQYVVEEAVLSGIEDILIITGKGKRAIEDHFDISCELERKLRQKNDKMRVAEEESLSSMADIHYIRQKRQRGLGDAILHARRHCDNEPFAVLLGDTITVSRTKTCTMQMIEAFYKYNKMIIAVEPVAKEKVKDYGIIDGEAIDKGVFDIKGLVEKPTPEHAPSNLGAIGRYILTPEIFDLLDGLEPGHGGEIQLTDALRQVNGAIGLVTDCKRYDIGDKIGWMKSNLELALARDEFAEELSAFMKTLIQES